MQRLQEEDGTKHLTPALVTGLGLLALAACAISLHITERTPLLSPDSAAYLSAAHNLVAGKGLTTGFNPATSLYHPTQAAAIYGHVPLAQYGPLYPALLAAAHYFGLSPYGAVRAVGVVTLAGFIGVVGVLAARMLDRQLFLVLLLVALCIVAPGKSVVRWDNSLSLSTFALSDLLFYVLALAAVLALHAALKAPSPGRLFAVAFLIAAATLTRYAGISIAAVAALGAACEESWPTRWRQLGAIGAIGIGLGAFLGWDVINAFAFGATSPRAVVFHPDGQLGSQMLRVAGPWFFPGGWSSGWTSCGALVIVLGVLVLCFWGGLRDEVFGADSPALPVRLWRIGGFFVISYTVMLVVTRTWLDASLAIDDRILGPLQIVLYLLIASLLYWIVRCRRRAPRPRAWAVGAVTVAGCLTLLPNTGSVASQLSFVAPANKTEAAIGVIPKSTFVMTDDTASLYLFYGLDSILLPAQRFLTTTQTNAEFFRDLEDVGRLVRRHHGLVIVFPTVLTGVPTALSQLLSVSHLAVSQLLPDGGVILAARRS